MEFTYFEWGVMKIKWWVIENAKSQQFKGSNRNISKQKTCMHLKGEIFPPQLNTEDSLKFTVKNTFGDKKI